MKNCQGSSVYQRVIRSLVCLAVGLLGPSLAQAHPLGNFTINHFTRIEVGTDGVKVRQVIDMAEIPTFQELPQIDTNGDGKASAEELDAYVNRAAGQLASAMSLSVDGARVPLSVAAKRIGLPPGAGALETLRIELDLTGQFSAVGANGVREI